MEEIKLEFEAIRQTFCEEEFDYFILNIESRPEIKIGFRTFCEGISKELMFNGEKWNKEKGINLTERNIKIYLKLQLYPRFEKLLKNFSLSRQ